jgi:hypothetical protein
MALRGRDRETQVASEQIQRGRKRAMETPATAIKAGQRCHKWAMVQATATVMYHKGSSFYNSIINKDGPWMLARQRDNDEQQFKSPPSSNTVSLRRISFFAEIRSPQKVTPFFAKTPHFPLNQIKLPLQQSPSWFVIIKLCGKKPRLLKKPPAQTLPSPLSNATLSIGSLFSTYFCAFSVP